ncbi:hypothetical protein Tco_0004899 [Tanacetum coccineum]
MTRKKIVPVRTDEGTVDQTEGRRATPTTPTTTPTMFGDDETIAQVLLNMSQAKAVSREKEKGVELKDVEETERPTSIPEAKKKFKQLAMEKRWLESWQEDWEIEEERERLAELQDKERESSSLWKKEQSSFMIQLQLKEGFLAKNKELFQSKQNLLPELSLRFDESFTAVGSTEDERRIKEMNKGVKDTDQKLELAIYSCSYFHFSIFKCACRSSFPKLLNE